MLAELALYVASPCPADHRRLGHLSAAVSLWSRATRCAAAWAPHYARCRAVVERAVADLPRRRKAVVLGSGLCRDVPVERLAAAFETLVLVDVVHLAPVRWRLSGLRNLRFEHRDLTGTTDLLLGRSDRVADPLAALAEDPDIDLVVSANCLSQLPLGPRAALARGRSQAALPADLERRILAAHWDGLRRLPARVCLLTDTCCRTQDRAGRTLERLDLVPGLDLPPTDERWDWALAPLGEDGPDHTLVHEARGYPDLAAALKVPARSPARPRLRPVP
ncbi:hypothetical protein [Prosthecomicrobium sp. N25]|uniref:hypothetical protein n=1 Tax=Prosthecomicrobium sp. N25 TaxID=3129254 RepID=UPI003076DF68